MQNRKGSVCIVSAILVAAPFAHEVHAGGTPPVNDACSSATVIPGTVAIYNPPLYNTSGATNEPCPSNETCEVSNVGTSNSVWYRYTPAVSGIVNINTFGSTSYNTVLSVWDGCPNGSPPFCAFINQIACNDNTVGSLSQIVMNVIAGDTYYIKVSDYNTADGGGTLDFNLNWTPANDTCANATVINSRNYQPSAYFTNNADIDSCEASESCELNNVGVSNSVWYKFVSLDAGLLTIDTGGSNYDTVVSIFNGCSTGISPACIHPLQLECDDDSGIGTTSRITDFPVMPGVEYLIKVADYNTSSGGGLLVFSAVFEESCPGDTNHDGSVNVTDLLEVIAAWGRCP